MAELTDLVYLEGEMDTLLAAKANKELTNLVSVDLNTKIDSERFVVQNNCSNIPEAELGYLIVIRNVTDTTHSGQFYFSEATHMQWFRETNDTGASWTLWAVLYQPYDADTVLTSTTNLFTKAQRGNISILTYGATVITNMSLANRYKLTMTGNAIMGLPTNIVAGQGGLIYVVQDSSGGHALTWEAGFKFFNEPNEDTTANKVNVYAYEVYDVNTILVSHLGSF